MPPRELDKQRVSPALIRAVFAALMFLWMPGVQAQPEPEIPPPTLNVYQTLCGEALTEAFAGVHVPESLKVAVVVEPAGAYWYLEAAIINGLRERGLQPVPAGETWQLSCAVKEAYVHYADPRRDGLLGARVVDRTVTLVLWLRVTDRGEQQYLVDRDVRTERTDTIDVSDVRLVEHPEIAATRAVLPSEGFFSSWLEPLIMVGAIGVAIFLLFTTRS